MGKIQDTYDAHPVHPTIKGLKNKLTTIENDSETFLKDEQSLEYFERIKQVTLHLEKALGATDPFLTAIDTLNKINSVIQQQNAQLNDFINTKNPGHLSNANGHCDSILTTITNLSIPKIPEDIESLRDAIASFRRSTGQYMSSINKEYQELNDQISALRNEKSKLENEIQAQKGRLDNAITEFQQQFSQAESNRSQSFDALQAKRSERFDGFLSSSKDEASKSQDSFKSEFDKTRNDFISKTDTFLKTEQEEFSKIKKNLDEQSESTLQSLLDHKDKAENIVGIIAATGIAGGYQKVAKEEYTAYLIFQGIAIASFLGLIGFAIWTFISITGEKPVELYALIAKTVATLSFGVLAGYAASQASHHQKASRQNRKMELELTALGPYLASLPEDKQNQIKEELSSKLFGNHQVLEASEQVEKSANLFADSIKLIIDSVGDLAKKIK